MALPEILIFSDGEKRILKPDSFHNNNFVLQLLGLKQYNSEIKLLETPVYRDLQNNIIYFRDILPISSTQWDIYMKAVRFGDVIQEDLDELKTVINIFGGDPHVETIIHNMVNENKIESKYLYPRSPQEDKYGLYNFKVAKLNDLNQSCFKDYTITGMVSLETSQPSLSTIYWIRTPRY
tara:strand:- start:208 stop:744 length:537 start_codon:yes stop_codon:yes gene_type:complete